MKIDGNSQLPLTALKGALLINEHGAEFRIEDFVVQLDDVTDIWVSLREYDKDGELLAGSIGVSFSSIKSWTIQLQGEEKS